MSDTKRRGIDWRSWLDAPWSHLFRWKKARDGRSQPRALSCREEGWIKEHADRRDWRHGKDDYKEQSDV